LLQIVEFFSLGQASRLDMYFSTGVLADRDHPEQCKTSASTRAGGMNFPRHAKNPKIPAQKLKGHETVGKILPE
jgi:hypothetical protein